MRRNGWAVMPGDRYLLLQQGRHGRGMISIGVISKIIGHGRFLCQPQKWGFFVRITPEIYIDPYDPEQAWRRLDIGVLIERWPLYFDNNPRPWVARCSGHELPAEIARQITTAFKCHAS